MSYETLGRFPRFGAPRGARPAPARVALKLYRGARPVLLTDYQGDGLGFSLKPPKWLRKLQPGKILAKAAVPLAIGATLLIPGVGAAVVGAGAAALKGIGKVAGGVASGVGGAVKLVRDAVPEGTTVTMPAAPDAPAPPTTFQTPVGTVTVQTPATNAVPVQAGIGTPTMLAAGLGLVLLLAMRRK